MRLSSADGGIHVESVVVAATKDPFSVFLEWVLDSRWRTRSCSIRLIRDDTRAMLIERVADTTWRIDGRERPDLGGCDEVDLSITPFCNTVALRRFGAPPGGAGELLALYVDFPELTCSPSRQRYERIAETTFKYSDLGLHSGFEARLIVDADGIVQSYEGLFQILDDYD